MSQRTAAKITLTVWSQACEHARHRAAIAMSHLMFIFYRRKRQPVASSGKNWDNTGGMGSFRYAARTTGPEAPGGRDRQCCSYRADSDWRNRRNRTEAASEARKRLGRRGRALESNVPTRAQRDRSYCSGEPMEAINVDQLTHSVLAQVNVDLGKIMGGDVVLINSGMFPPLDDEFRVAIEAVREASSETHLIVLLETNGGLMETVERLVAVMRTHYDKVSFVIPNFAYSSLEKFVLINSSIVLVTGVYSFLGSIVSEDICFSMASFIDSSNCSLGVIYLLQNMIYYS